MTGLRYEYAKSTSHIEVGYLVLTVRMGPVIVWYLQAFATVMSAAEDQDADSEEYGKFDSLKQYPFLTFFLF